MKTLTIEIPDELYQAVERAAARDGRPVEAVAQDWLARQEPPERATLSDAERRAARERLRRFAGCISSGDPRFGDNDRIDADLAREYGNDHEESR